MLWVHTLTNRANDITSQAATANLIYVEYFERIPVEQTEASMLVCVWCIFPVSSQNQLVNGHLWAAGHLAAAQLPHGKEENCWPPHTTVYACTNKQYITSHRHTNIHKHTRPLDHTLAHKHISLSSLWRQTLPCLLPRRKLSQEGATDQRLSFMLRLSLYLSLSTSSVSISFSFLFSCFYRNLYINT